MLSIEGAIGPMTYHQVKSAVRAAEKEKAEFLLIRIDTPGGLLSSTRKIVQEILEAEVPVIAYVCPKGAQCASAGTFIALACHVLAMAPATNIGAAHPVTMGGGQDKTMEEKAVNDTVSFIKSIAALRHKNADWAEKAVRKSISSTADEALAEGICDLIAENQTELLQALDGRTVTLPDGDRVLNTGNSPVNETKPRLAEKLLSVISDPNIAYILLLIGIWGIILEFSHPGAAVPGVVGTVALLLAFFALQAISMSMTGFLLVIVSLIFFVIEAVTPGFGVFLVAGVITLSLGSLMLLRSPSGAAVSATLVWGGVALTAVVMGNILFFVGSARRRHITTGNAGMVGERGTAVTEIAPEGRVFVHGEYWNARAEQAIAKDAKIVVTGINGLTLTVKEERET